jgi:DNA-binding transcriptional ArsR family regulator
MVKLHPPGLRSVHRVLADPIRIRLLEYLWLRPQSAKELAKLIGRPPDRLYYHLARLERARLIEIAEYRRLPGGKVERIYRPASIEPPGDDATSLEIAEFLGAMLEATRADISAASEAKEAGERREIMLQRTAVKLTEAEHIKLRERILELVRLARDKSNEAGVWTRVVVTFIDLQDRRPFNSEGDPV